MIDTETGGSTLADAAALLDRRDALARVATVTSRAEAEALLALAHASGDVVLVQAVTELLTTAGDTR